MDPDLSEFEEPGGNAACKVRTILGQLEGERKEKLTAALDNEAIHHRKIARVVTGWGYPIGESTVGNHRRKGCNCDH